MAIIYDNGTSTVSTQPIEGGWNSGDEYLITDGYPCRDQIGRGKDSALFDLTDFAASTSEVAYVWNNTVNGQTGVTSAAFPILLGRDIVLGERPEYSIYTCPHPLAGSGTCDPDVAGTAGYSITGEAEEDETPPTLTSALINAAGTSLYLYFSETVVATINTGFAITPSGGAATLTYASGSGSSTLVYTISRAIQQSETLTGAYTQPGNGIEDAAGNDLATIESFNVTNQSQQAEPPLRELTVTATRATVTSAPSGINCGSTCSYEYENGTTVTLGGYCDAGSRNLTFTGDCASNGTVTMDGAKACTVTCEKIQVLYLIAP